MSQIRKISAITVSTIVGILFFYSGCEEKSAESGSKSGKVKESTAESVHNEEALRGKKHEFAARRDLKSLKGVALAVTFENGADAEFAANDSKAEIHGANVVEDGFIGKGLRLGKDAWASYNAKDNFSGEGMTVMFWFKPAWDDEKDTAEHTIFSLPWNEPAGKDIPPYTAFTDGWWDAKQTYFIMNNWYCNAKRSLVHYPRDKWIHVACVSRYGPGGGARYFINGDLRGTGAAKPDTPARLTPKSRFYLGSDLGTHNPAKRSAPGVVDELLIYNRALTDDEIRKAIAQYPGWNDRATIGNVDPEMAATLAKPYTPRRDKQGRILESRVIADENWEWLTEESADKTLDKIKRAGFNVFVPCVWKAWGASYRTDLYYYPDKMRAQKDPEEAKKAFADGRDPLKRLIEKAHALGIEVHPWFCVVYGTSEHVPETVPGVADARELFSNQKWKDGKPGLAFDAHSETFRTFIVNIMLDMVKRYEVDGLNLDYIRTGIKCTCERCRKQYHEKYGRDLLADWKEYDKLDNEGKLKTTLEQWQEDAISDIWRRVSAGARKLKPNILMSAYSHVYPDHADWQGRKPILWEKNGWCDFMMDMSYETCLDPKRLDDARKAITNPDSIVYVCGNYEVDEQGQGMSRDAALVANLMEYCQKRWPGSAVSLYLLTRLDEAQIKALREGPFREDSLPSWKLMKK
jgi:hypothetical protein